MLSRLSSSNVDGKHFLVFAPAVKVWLKDGGVNLDIRKRDRELINAIASEYSARFGLFKQSSVKLIVSLSLSGLEEQSPGNYTIGYASYMMGNWSAEANLLVENIDEDGQFYRHVLNEMRKKKKLPNINFRLGHGGGTSIERVFNDVLSRKEIAVALIDGDRVSPYSECSVVEKKLRKTKSTVSTTISEVMPIPCRDVENIIPPYLLKECGVFPEYDADEYEILMMLYMSNYPDNISYAFFDVKLGLTKLKAESIRCEKTKEWLKNNILTVNGEIVDRVRGLGENVLSTFLANGELVAKFIEYISSEYWMAVFNEFFERVLDFVISDRRMVTR